MLNQNSIKLLLNITSMKMLSQKLKVENVHTKLLDILILLKTKLINWLLYIILV